MITDQKTGLLLSIIQPWAWCIVHRHKLVENRTWKTAIRGWIGIHAGKKFDREGYEWIQNTFPTITLPAIDQFERGGIVGRARLIDCVTEAQVDAYGDSDPWFFGPVGFVFADADPLPFQACAGKLGFFRLQGAA